MIIENWLEYDLLPPKESRGEMLASANGLARKGSVSFVNTAGSGEAHVGVGQILDIGIILVIIIFGDDDADVPGVCADDPAIDEIHVGILDTLLGELLVCLVLISDLVIIRHCLWA